MAHGAALFCISHVVSCGSVLTMHGATVLMAFHATNSCVKAGKLHRFAFRDERRLLVMSKNDKEARADNGDGMELYAFPRARNVVRDVRLARVPSMLVAAAPASVLASSVVSERKAGKPASAT